MSRDSWKERGVCRNMDPGLFYPPSNRPDDVAAALAACAVCPVIEPCKEAGLVEHYGVWGGMTEKDRRKERRRQRPAVRPRAQHGTRGKYILELRAGETPCFECRMANAQYQAEWSAS